MEKVGHLKCLHAQPKKNLMPFRILLLVEPTVQAQYDPSGQTFSFEVTGKFNV